MSESISMKDRLIIFLAIFGLIGIVLALFYWDGATTAPQVKDLEGYVFFVDNRGGPATLLEAGDWRLDVPADKALAYKTMPIPSGMAGTKVTLDGDHIGTVRSLAEVDDAATKGQTLDMYRCMVVDTSGKRCYTARNIRYEAEKPVGFMQSSIPDMNLEGQRLYFVPDITDFMKDPPKEIKVRVGITTYRYAVLESSCPPPPTAWDNLNAVAKAMMEDRSWDRPLRGARQVPSVPKPRTKN